MSLTKDEVVKMAREAGAIISPQWGVASNVGTATFERFATLCRAPLVAENEALREQLYKEMEEARAALLAASALKPVAEIGVSVFTWLGDRPPAGTTLYRIEQP